MPSARRVRTILFTTLIGALVLIYITTASRSTKSSPFYTKTAALMKESRDTAAGAGAAVAAAVEEKLPQPPRDVKTAVAEITNMILKVKDSKEKAALKAPSTAIDQDPSLRQRLQDAANAAKASADSRFREMKNAQKVIDVANQKDEAEKSIAGRKKMPTTTSVAKSELSEEEKAAAEAEEAEKAIQTELTQILARSPVVIFSKSYCPYSKKGKHIMMEAYNIQPTPYVVELDQHAHGGELQALLHKTTGRRTVPNILVGGKSLGGGDDVQDMWRSGTLADKVKQMAKGKVTKVMENIKYPSEGRRRKRSILSSL